MGTIGFLLAFTGYAMALALSTAKVSGAKPPLTEGTALYLTPTRAAVTGTETTILLVTCGAACEAEPQPTVTSQSATKTAKASSFDDWVD